MELLNFYDQGMCRYEDPELFFPISESSDDAKRQIEEAKQICKICQVNQKCLEWALERPKEDGVWGGTTKEERVAMRAKGRARVVHTEVD